MDTKETMLKQEERSKEFINKLVEDKHYYLDYSLNSITELIFVLKRLRESISNQETKDYYANLNIEAEDIEKYFLYNLSFYLGNVLLKEKLESLGYKWGIIDDIKDPNTKKEFTTDMPILIGEKIFAPFKTVFNCYYDNEEYIIEEYVKQVLNYV